MKTKLKKVRDLTYTEKKALTGGGVPTCECSCTCGYGTSAEAMDSTARSVVQK